MLLDGFLQPGRGKQTAVEGQAVTKSVRNPNDPNTTDPHIAWPVSGDDGYRTEDHNDGKGRPLVFGSTIAKLALSPAPYRL